jgi:ribonuclease-3
MRQQPKYLEQSLGYNFSNNKLLIQALTHRSYSDQNNERLEFLGDSLLGVIITQELYDRFPTAQEGDLSRVRSSLVNGDALSDMANEFEISKYILLGEGELRSGGLQRRSILADCLEAIVAAVYLDSSFEICKKTVLSWYEKYSHQINKLDLSSITKDPKTILQEWLQAKQYELPEYTVVSQIGIAHDMTFSVKCAIKKLNITTDGTAKSRRKAEQIAATLAMEQIKIIKNIK